MANLQAIYQEFGLSGLIPYALKPEIKGRQLLIEKIKEGAPLFYLESVFGVPFIRVHDGEYQMLAYTERAEAEAAQDRFWRERYETSIQTFPSEDVEDAIKGFFAAGPVSVRVDDTIPISLSQFADLPNYDGHPTPDHILLNRNLNGSIFYYFQTAFAQKGNAAAERQWAERMASSDFLIAVEDDAANGYPFLTTPIGDAIGLYIFTDWREVGKAFPGKAPACMIVTYAELDEILNQQPNCKLLLNKGSCHCVIDAGLMTTVRTILNSANFTQEIPIVEARTKYSSSVPAAALSQASEEDWDTADPTPDWLK